MRLYLLILALIAAPAFAAGPKYNYPDPHLDDELVNVYHDIKSVPNGTYKSSSMTLQGITVDSITVKSSYNISGTNLGSTLGKLIQIGQGATGSATTSTNTAFIATNLSISIAPHSTSNAILIVVSGELGVGTNGERATATIERNGINLSGASGFSALQCPTASCYAGTSFSVQDNPNTTSAVTYAVYLKSSGGGTVYWMPTISSSTLQAFEFIP